MICRMIIHLFVKALNLSTYPRDFGASRFRRESHIKRKLKVMPIFCFLHQAFFHTKTTTTNRHRHSTNMSSVQWTEIWSRYDAIEKSLPFIITVALVLIISRAFQASRSNVPLANPKKGLELSRQRAKKDFVSHANRLVGDWFKTNPNKPMRFIGDVEEITVLPPSLAQEIRNDKRLSFNQWTYKVLSSCFWPLSAL